ncbi:hypothetical protein BDV41DRAFT_572347 [Aspergillus transmontanensis]|uniref:Uncharacterized protein n=1 Tax=Aspergillus transmontanensis TaxID=1034304 RepID=A0A5N6WAJ4_9EURO|nr:hypothetical protein BDV41DRAFT_572347 [Aspergillus transmontanensis]
MYAFLLDLLVALGLLGLNQARSCRRYASRPLQASVEIASGLVLTNDALDVLTSYLQLRRARAQGIIPQLTDSCLNVVEEAVSSLAISNVKCDRTDLLARLLYGSAVAESGGGRWGCEIEVFDGAILG